MSARKTADVEAFVERMRPLVDETIERLRLTGFREDPIGGRKYSRATSIISSAYKRHGQILGRALLERLRDCARFEVWEEPAFRLSEQSLEQVHLHQHVGKCLSLEFPYGDGSHTVPIDAIVHDKSNSTLRAYNMKRGNGSYDAGKRRLIQTELLRTNMLLRDYARTHGHRSVATSVRIIFYYGLRSIEPPLSLIGTELDQHFEFPVVDALEGMNEYFRSQLYRLVEHE